jgi:hypothetical protein
LHCTAADQRTFFYSFYYKVANYGLGGLYTVHYDQVLMGADPKSREARQVFNIVAGDRITTVGFNLRTLSRFENSINKKLPYTYMNARKN